MLEVTVAGRQPQVAPEDGDTWRSKCAHRPALYAGFLTAGYLSNCTMFHQRLADDCLPYTV